MTINKIEVKWF